MPTMPKRKRPAALTKVQPASLSSGWSILDNPGDTAGAGIPVPVSKPMEPMADPQMASQGFPLTPFDQSRMPPSNPAMQAPPPGALSSAPAPSGPTFVGTPGELSPNQGFNMDPKGGSVQYGSLADLFGGGEKQSAAGEPAPQGEAGSQGGGGGGWSGAQGLSDFLINAGAATLENDGDIFKGAAGGIRGWQAAKKARAAQDAAAQQQDFENSMKVRSADQGDRQVAQGDRRIDQDAAQFGYTQERDDRNFGFQQEQFGYQREHDAAVLGNTIANQGEQRAIERARLAIARKQAEDGSDGGWTSQILPDEAGGAVAVRINKSTGETLSRASGATDWSPGVPEGVRAGLSMVSPSVQQDEKHETSLASQANASLDQIDSMQRIVQLSKEAPDQLGPSWQAGVTRYVTQALGLEGTGAVQEMMRTSSDNELAAAMSQRGLGQLTETERAIIRKSILDPTSIDAATVGPIAQKLITKAEEDIDIYDKYLTANPSKRSSARGFSFTERNSKRNKNGGPQSGLKSNAGALSQQQNSLIDKYLQ